MNVGKCLKKRPPSRGVGTQSAKIPPPAPAGFGGEYDYSESYTEIEQTSFSASGTVKTADGLEISFKLELSMARMYHEESSVSLRLGDAARKIEQLGLNFAGKAGDPVMAAGDGKVVYAGAGLRGYGELIIIISAF
mgnify:CR=1 FL=1